MEPEDLWEKLPGRAVQAVRAAVHRGPRTTAANQPVIRIGDLELAEISKRTRTAVVGRDLQRRAFARHPHNAVAHARGYDAESHVAAMDLEGIDVAVIYGTPGGRC